MSLRGRGSPRGRSPCGRGRAGCPGCSDATLMPSSRKRWPPRGPRGRRSPRRMSIVRSTSYFSTFLTTNHPSLLRTKTTSDLDQLCLDPSRASSPRSSEPPQHDAVYLLRLAPRSPQGSLQNTRSGEHRRTRRERVSMFGAPGSPCERPGKAELKIAGVRRALDLGLIVGFLAVDFLFFHDIFKAGEVTTIPSTRPVSSASGCSHCVACRC